VELAIVAAGRDSITQLGNARDYDTVRVCNP